MTNKVFLIVLLISFFITPSSLFSQSNEEVDRIFLTGTASSAPEHLMIFATKLDSISTITGDVLTALKAQIVLGKYYLTRSKILTADSLLMHCEKTFCVNVALKKTVAYSKMLMVRSLVYYQLGEPDASFEYRKKALTVARELKSVEQEMSVLQSISVLENSQDHPEEALYYFMQYLSLKEKFNQYVADEAHDYLLLADIYSSIKQFNNAKMYTNKALAIQAELGKQKQLSFSYNSLGVIHRGLGQFDSAFVCFNTAKEIAMESDQPLVVFNANNNIAITHFMMGNYSEAIRLLDKLLAEGSALPLIAQLNPMYFKASSLYQLGRYDLAMPAAWKVYNTSVDLEYKRAIVEAADLLANLYIQKKRYDSATYFLQRKVALKDSMTNFITQDKFTQVHAQLHTLEKQKEIELLEQQSASQRAQNRLLILSLFLGLSTAGLAVVTLVLRYKNNRKRQQLISLELQSELHKSRSELEQQAVRMIHINNGLNEVFNTLKKEKAEGTGRLEVQSMINSINVNQSLDRDWENFDKYFGSVHREFIEQLSEAFPFLTLMEKRLAALVKMNLANKEIASILNIEPRSVTVAKYRLKKRLGLNNTQDVHDYLLNLARGLDGSKIPVN